MTSGVFSVGQLTFPRPLYDAHHPCRTSAGEIDNEPTAGLRAPSLFRILCGMTDPAKRERAALDVAERPSRRVGFWLLPSA